MSAYVVSAAHINLMVDFARSGGLRSPIRLPYPPQAYGLSFNGYNGAGWWESAGARAKFDPMEHPDDLGRALWMANHESVRARYPDHYATDFGNAESCATYRAPRHPHIFGATPLKRDAEIGHVLKQLDCFDYQACEVENYASTWAAAVTAILRADAYPRLTGYAAAPWGL